MKKKKTFTLIELLIVVSIIAILAALLLPTLNKARMKAQNMKCLNNIKTYNQTLILYADAYNGWLVSTYSLDVWYTKLWEMANRPDKGKFYDCPAYKWKYAGTDKVFTTHLMPYGCNRFFGSSQGDMFKMTRVKRPSMVVSFADSDDDASYGLWVTGTNYPLGNRHGNTASIGFVDSHAAIMNSRPMQANVVYGTMDYSSTDGKPNTASTSVSLPSRLYYTWGYTYRTLAGVLTDYLTDN